jgi:CheY-like chemotaxis protein
MSQTRPIVAIVDDDVLVQRALARVLSTAGWHAVTFPSAEAFLQTGMQASPVCLVLDVWLPGMTGVELLEHLAATGTFLRDAKGHRPVYGGTARFQDDPHWRDLILFYEYFHGDNGAGLGASHQTG